MNITATTRNVRMSPKKVREVTRQIAGLPVSKAQAVLAKLCAMKSRARRSVVLANATPPNPSRSPLHPPTGSRYSL